MFCPRIGKVQGTMSFRMSFPFREQRLWGLARPSHMEGICTVKDLESNIISDFLVQGVADGAAATTSTLWRVRLTSTH